MRLAALALVPAALVTALGCSEPDSHTTTEADAGTLDVDTTQGATSVLVHVSADVSHSSARCADLSPSVAMTFEGEGGYLVMDVDDGDRDPWSWAGEVEATTTLEQVDGDWTSRRTCSYEVLITFSHEEPTKYRDTVEAPVGRIQFTAKATGLREVMEREPVVTGWVEPLD